MRPQVQLLLLGVAIAVAVGVFVALRWLPTPGLVASASRGFEVTAVQGPVVRDRDGVATPVAVGMELRPGDGLSTGPRGEAVLARGDATVRVLASTSLRVVGLSDGAIDVELASGQVRATVRPGAAAVSVRRGDRRVTVSDGDANVIVTAEDVLAAEVLAGTAVVEEAGAAVVVPAGRRGVLPGGVPPVLLDVPDAPLLDVVWPAEPAEGVTVWVEGRAEPGSVVRVVGGESSARVDSQGRFTLELPVTPSGAVTVAVRDVFGRERVVEGRVAAAAPSPGRRPSFRIDLGEPR